MSVITNLPITCWPPLAEDVPSPCACGGVVAWISVLQSWGHIPDVCLECATAGYAFCGDACQKPIPACKNPAAVECGTCSTDLTVEGCASCATEGDEQGDPDHAYDLHRERHW